MSRWTVALGLVVGSAVGCGGDKDMGSPSDPMDTGAQDTGSGGLVVRLVREPAAGPDPFVVEVVAAAATIRVDGAEVAADRVGDALHARVEPAADGDLVEVEVEAGGQVWRRTALVLEVGDGWGQPELVPGLVNTPAYEDGPEISADGEWLIISNYAPIDYVGCILTGPDVASPACNGVLGPYGAPERPDLPDGHRAASGDVDHRIPEYGLVGDDGGEFLAPLPPSAAYGFRRQPDGSFAEPFVIAFDMHGLPVAPFGFSFLDSGSARAVFAWDDATEAAEETDLYVADLVMGQPNWLGAVDALFTGAVDPAPVRWPLSNHAGFQSNPFAVDATTLLYDQHLPESDATNSDILVDDGATRRIAGFCRPDREEFQPFVHDDQLIYVTGGFEAIVAASWDGGDLGDPASFGPEAVIVAGGGRTPSVGEPSIGVHDGVPTLYFLAGRLPEGGGVDNTIARVAAR